MAVPAAWFGWTAFRLFGPVAGILVGAGVLSLAIPMMRTCLIVTDEDVVDRRLIRRVRVPWHRISTFSVDRPGWLWGGFCVVATCKDGTRVDLLSTRAYSRAPSSSHLDELHRLCWTLEELLTVHGDSFGAGP